MLVIEQFGAAAVLAICCVLALSAGTRRSRGGRREQRRTSPDARRRTTAVTARRRSAADGWWGMVVLIASEGDALRGARSARTSTCASTTPHWPPRGVPEPRVARRRRARRRARRDERPDAARVARGARTAGSRARWLLARRRARRPGGYLAYAGARLPRPARQRSPSRATPTARSTTRCSAPTTRTSSSASSSTSGCCEARARPHDLPRGRRAGDRLVLALRQHAHDRRHLRPCSRRALMSVRRLGVLQWVGLLARRRSPGRSQHPRRLSASPRPSAAPAARAGASSNDAWQAVADGARGSLVLAAEAARGDRASSQTRGTRASTTARPSAARQCRFFAIAAIARRTRSS